MFFELSRVNIEPGISSLKILNTPSMGVHSLSTRRTVPGTISTSSWTSELSCWLDSPKPSMAVSTICASSFPPREKSQGIASCGGILYIVEEAGYRGQDTAQLKLLLRPNLEGGSRSRSHARKGNHSRSYTAAVLVVGRYSVTKLTSFRGAFQLSFFQFSLEVQFPAHLLFPCCKL